MKPRGGWGRTLVAACRGWALVGGAALIAAALVTLVSVARRALIGAPIQGDIELVETAIAIAAFSFLPYCQIQGGHVVADLFTAHAPPRVRGALDMTAALIFAAVAALLAYSLAAGGVAIAKAGEDSMVLRIPSWLGYGPAAVSASLLALAALSGVTGRGGRRGAS